MGRRIEDLDWLELRAIARWSPESSALYRATHPEWRVTPELQFLRDIDHDLRILAWHNTEDGRRGLRAPKPVPLTKAERRAQQPEREKYRPKPIAEMLAWLGWTKPKG